ncbi:hypothetical protein KKK_26475 [Pseudomonas putida B6-2]|nr:hypothetical protein KKK_26475 [Pseudomonas putida B6-2]
MDMALAGWLPVLDLSRARPLPQDNHNPQVLWGACGSGQARERASAGITKTKPAINGGPHAIQL